MICGSIVIGLAPKEGCWNVLTGDFLAAAEVDSGHCWRVLEHLDVTCGTFAKALSADWSAKEGCGNGLPGDVAAAAKVSGQEVFAVCQDSNVTCETVAEKSSAD